MEAFAARRADVLEAHDLEERGAREPRDEAGAFVAEHEGGKDEPVEAARAGGRHQPERHREDEDHEDREGEAGDGHAAEREEHHRRVDRRAALDRRDHAERHAEDDGEEHRRARELERARQAIEDELCHRLVLDVRLSEVSADRVPEPAHVLDRERIVQPEVVADLLGEGDPLLRRSDAEGGRAHHRVDRIAGDEMQDREDQERREQHDRDRLDEPLCDELRHGANPWGPGGSAPRLDRRGRRTLCPAAE